MKKAARRPPQFQLTPHSAMQPNTQRFLRGAIQEALNAEDDAAAAELMAMLSGCTQPQPVAAPPALDPTIPGPAHDYHFWARLIRESFIPFMSNNGRMRFTSHELFSWIDSCSNLPLTDGDIEQRKDGAVVFRTRISDALNHLKQCGIVKAGPKSRVYEIVALPAASAQIASCQPRLSLAVPHQ